jgi:kumamolisin
MIRRLSASLLTVIAMVSIASVVGRAQMQSLMTRHVREVTVNGQASSVGRLPATQVMRLVVVLPLRHEPELEDFLQELYDPASPSYRHFLTVQEFTARFGPSPEDYDAVLHFAEANGLAVVGTSRNRLNVDVEAPVADIEKALHVTMGVYQHPTENRTFYAPSREPAVDLPFQLWHIAGLDNYSIPRPLFSRHANLRVNANATTGSGPDASFLGSDMRAAYYEGTALTGSGQSLGLLEYYGVDLADLNTYYTNVGQTNNVPITLLSTDGTSTSCFYEVVGYPSCNDTEQILDLTQALGMAPGLSSLVVYVGATDSAIFNAMATASPLNAQLSSSWTWSPADPSTDKPYFKEFAAQGQNLFQAAGDRSEWGSSSVKTYPEDGVYLTSVGGTDLVTGSAGGSWSSETAWADGGGGISPNEFAIPSWQTATASGCSSCSQTYRNGPDVSANANFTFYVCANQITPCSANEWGGTSFAAPMWAGYLALANQQSVANGKGLIGFINPTLYTIGLGSSYDSDFHDITSGSNGYSATTGYDLATGWGSPNGPGLINALAGPPPSSGFSLSGSPASVPVAQGSSGNSTISSTVTGGFNSAITLSATGQPTGVTVSFSPTSITGAGTSTMTMAVASSTVIGTYSITVTGTSGSTSETTTVSLTVTVPSSYTIGAAPASVSVAQGGSGSPTISSTVTGGFDSAIKLSASGQPKGVTVSFSPTSIKGAGTSTMTMKVGSSTVAGTYSITVTGTSGSTSETTTVSLTVTAATPSFTVSAAPSSISIARGSSGTFTITTAVFKGFDKAITLFASGQPTGVTVSFSPDIVTGAGTSTMIVNVGESAALGDHTITINGKNGSATHTTTVTLDVLN